MSNTPTQGVEGQITVLQQRAQNMEIQQAVTNHRMTHMESEVTSIRSEVKAGFTSVLTKLEEQRTEIANTKHFGKGVYWLIGIIVTGVIAFKSQIFGA